LRPRGAQHLDLLLRGDQDCMVVLQLGILGAQAGVGLLLALLRAVAVFIRLR